MRRGQIVIVIMEGRSGRVEAVKGDRVTVKLAGKGGRATFPAFALRPANKLETGASDHLPR